MKKIFLLLIFNFITLSFAADKDAAYQGYLKRCHVANERAKIAQEKLFEYIPMVLAQIIKQYLELKCITYDQWLKNGQDLIKAASDGNLEKVKELLQEEEVDVNAKDYAFETALIKASRNGYKEIVELLINANANVNEKTPGMSALIVAVSYGHKEIVELLINAKADVNAQSDSTALIWATMNGHREIAEMLIKAGADVNAKDRYDLTALKAANDEEDEEIAKLLRNAGAQS